MSQTLKVTLHNRLSELERVGEVVESFGETHRLPPKVVHAVTLCVDEVVTNIIGYAYADQADHRITLRLSLQADELAAEVEDDGKPFNPLDAPEPDLSLPLEERPIGGLGVHFVRKLMDGVEYRREQGKNLLVMKKHVSA
ncbi:MAG: ATP-binding protein [Nitrospirota bacterium]|nr:ATP-binding protein [Nitrospirota bacterium]MDE3243723.1 ATP-binding protein [Nitrospirota bacterium]